MVLDERHFPGRQGRLLFAYLVAEHQRAVPRDELAHVLWGDAPPATWEKALSVLVSKLRALLVAGGIDGASALTAAFRCYRLDLPEGTWVDVLTAEAAVKEAEGFQAANELEKATTAAALAETLTQGVFLPGDDGPWVEAKRRELAGMRARALGGLAEASLGSGHAAEAVRWAELAIEAEPFRESGYRRLMEAHIGSGNRAEALQVYERCRRLLADELGAYPSPETESIYRDLLEAPAGRPAAETFDADSAAGAVASLRPGRRRSALVAVAVAVAVAAGAAIAIVAKRGDGVGTLSAAGTPRVALVVPRSPGGIATDDSSVAPYLSALEQARNADHVKTKIFAIDPSRPGLPRQVRQSIGSFGLVLLAGELADDRFANVIARHPHTRFAVIDPPNADTNNTPLYRAVTRDANATDVFFSTGPAAYLAGYLSSLMGQRRDPGKRQMMVSIIVSDPTLNENEVSGFEAGVGAANPKALVRVDQTHGASDPSVCERIANREINAGSTTVYADAGTACNVGAISAAEVRDVWAIASDPSQRGPQILAAAVKRIGRAADDVITRYLEGTLPRGHFDVGIERQDVAIVNLNRAISARIRAELAQAKQQNMKYWASFETPLR